MLLRRLRDEAQAFTWEFGKPIRRKRPQLVQEESVRVAVRLALLREECNAIIILFDGDDDCPADLGPQVQGWAQSEAADVPCAVVIAHREYEAWFLAAMEPPIQAPETMRGAKGRFNTIVGGYLPTVDQASHSAQFDLALAHRRSRSFRHLVSAFGRLVLGPQTPGWPPPNWWPAV